MLMPYLTLLNSKHIVLGSQSKSRHHLLSSQGLKYERVPSTFPEDLDKKSFPSSREYNVATCKGKINELIARFDATKKPWDILICADTILEHEGNILEKPVDFDDCVKMMGSLCNKQHRVLTAHEVCFNSEPRIQYSWVIEADVVFGDIPLESLQAYAQTEEPYLHSGGYELFGMSGSFIREIKGSMSSVQGIDTYEVGKYIIEGLHKAKWI